MRTTPITRRRACGMLGGATIVGLTRRLATAAAADWSFVSFPDPQYLSTQTPTGSGGSSKICSPYAPDVSTTMYARMMQWVIDNQAAWNIKFAISMGDCSDAVSSVGLNDQETVTSYAWNKLRTAGIPDQPCLGNHDCGFDVGTPNRRPSYGFKTGMFSHTATSAYYGAGRSLYNGGTGYWGGHFTEPGGIISVSGGNSYTRFLTPDGRKILVISVEFFPRAEVLNWAKGVHDGYPDHEVWLTTHAYKRLNNAIYQWNDDFAPGFYGYSASPHFNSGDMMWGGPGAGADASLTGYLSSWRNLTLILCGHDVSTASGWWYWTHLAQTSTSDRGQTVNAVTCNLQGVDFSNVCGTGSLTQAGQVMIHKVRPSLGTMEMYVVSTNTGEWLGDCVNHPCSVGTMWNASPYLLKSIPFGGIMARGIFPMPSSFGSAQ